MKKLLTGVSLAAVLLGTFFLSINPASAHRSGCHRWHSCPSDTGSYVCGDLGYTSGCPTYTPPTTYTQPVQPQSTSNSTDYFVGRPRTYTQLFNCKIVGNYNSYIYHLKGSKYIREMTLKNKECFATEAVAKAKGFRKARAR